MSGFWHWTVQLTIAGTVLDAWDFQLPSSPSSRDLYSLANQPLMGTNPMTTLGDLIYGGSGGALTRLPGDTSNTRKFLRELSVASVATAPAWDSLLPSDIPLLVPTAVKTSAYAANPGELVPCDTTGGAFTVTLPAAPADKTRIAVKLVKQSGANTVTVAASGSDVLNVAAGPVTETVTVLDQCIVYQYALSTAIWYALSGENTFSLPLTTLGDTLYEGSSGPARLPGNATAAKQFLTQTGTGSASAAPAWGAIQMSDLAPVGSPAPGKYAGLLYGATWGMPWQFWPDSDGAAGDGMVLGDCSISSGQAVLSSASYGFVNADVGKYVMLNGGLGTANVPLIAPIISVSGGNATLSVSATVTISGNGACVFGTDAASKLATTFSRAGTYALAGNYDAEVILWGIYVAASAPVKSGNGTTVPYFYTQVPLPYPAVSGATRKAVVTVTGPAANGHAEYWESTVPAVLPGSIVSMVTTAMVGNTPDPTYGRASVIGGPSGSAALTGAFANTKAVFRNTAIWLPVFNNLQGLDLGYIGGCAIDQVAVKAFAPVGVGGGVQPYLNQLPPLTAFQSNISRGVRFPLSGNNDDVVVTRLVVEGVETGFCASDHLTALSIATLWCDLAGLIDLTEGVSGGGHSVTIAQWSAEGYNGALRSNGGGGANTQVNIVLDTEPYGGGDPLYDINDAGSLYGIVRIGDNGGRPNRRPVVFNGAPNLKIINDMMGPGLWTNAVTPGPPAVAASGTAVLNNSYRDCTVIIAANGATITAIAVNGTTLTGITGGQIRVPSGATVTLTYTGGPPAWQWWRE